MVALDPSINGRRLRWERSIWIVDMLSYIVLGVSGYVALFNTSDFVLKEVRSREAIILWGVLLLGGGIAGFFGRLTRRWGIEVVGNIGAMSGGAIYIIIICAAVASGSSMVLLGFVTAATLAMYRRYSELQIFTSEPGLTTFSDRVQSLLQRRTTNVVKRRHY